MADALSAIPAAVLRNLSDKLYEKRKNAALEVLYFLYQQVLGFCVVVFFFLDLGFWSECCVFLKVEGIVKQLAAAGDHDKITAVINLLTNDFTYSPQANHRKVKVDERGLELGFCLSH